MTHESHHCMYIRTYVPLQVADITEVVFQGVPKKHHLNCGFSLTAFHERTRQEQTFNLLAEVSVCVCVCVCVNAEFVYDKHQWVHMYLDLVMWSSCDEQRPIIWSSHDEQRPVIWSSRDKQSPVMWSSRDEQRPFFSLSKQNTADKHQWVHGLRYIKSYWSKRKIRETILSEEKERELLERILKEEDEEDEREVCIYLSHVICVVPVLWLVDIVLCNNYVHVHS